MCVSERERERGGERVKEIKKERFILSEAMCNNSLLTPLKWANIMIVF